MIQQMLAIWSLVPLPFLKPAWTMEWVAFPFSRGSSRPRDWTQVSHIAGRRFNLTHQGSPSILKFPEHFLHFHVLTEAWLFPKNTPSWKKQESSRKTSISDLLTMPKPLTVWVTINWKILKEMEYQTTWPVSWETYMQVRKQQLELDMEQQTGFK